MTYLRSEISRKDLRFKLEHDKVIGQSGNSSGGTDYQSSGSIVKDMIEQGTNFNWAKYAIDIPSLPCFKPEAEWPAFGGRNVPLTRVLADGYQAIGSFIVRVTGEDPSVTSGTVPTFTDCEPVLLDVSNLSGLTPVRLIHRTSTDLSGISESFYNPSTANCWGPTPLRIDTNPSNYVIAVGFISEGA